MNKSRITLTLLETGKHRSTGRVTSNCTAASYNHTESSFPHTVQLTAIVDIGSSIYKYTNLHTNKGLNLEDPVLILRQA